jgi:hypothetical protein
LLSTMSGRSRPQKARNMSVTFTACDYIHLWTSLLPGSKVVLCYRVSCSEQDRQNTQAGQIAWLRYKALPLNLDIVDVRGDVVSGYKPEWLEPVARLARRHNATMIFESTDRAIRHPDYTKTEQTVQLGPSDFENLRRITDGVPIATWLHPDATPEMIRSHQTHRGAWWQEVQKPSVRRRLFLPSVLALHSSGLSNSRIRTATGIHMTTLCRWIDEHAKNGSPISTGTESPDRRSSRGKQLAKYDWEGTVEVR